MPRTTATFSVSLPPEMAQDLERVRKREHRTRSELVREALRGYIRAVDARELRARIAELPEEEAAADEIAALRVGKIDFDKGKHRTFDRFQHELRRPSRRPRAKKS